MGKNSRNNLKGQVMLETSLVFICLVLLLGGIINIWLWSNKQIVKRQEAYNAGRVNAGQSSDSYTVQWPVYTPEDLSEDKVLVGHK